jgi:hypothetical protein
MLTALTDTRPPPADFPLDDDTVGTVQVGGDRHQHVGVPGPADVACVHAEHFESVRLDTLGTAFYAAADDLLKAHQERIPYRPRIGISPRITDAELITLCLMQALLGYTSEARWLRYARGSLHTMFPYLPGQASYNKRLPGWAPP